MEESVAQSNSPRVSPIQLRDCFEQLLEFVLQSSANETLEFNLGLSTHFCSALLKDDDDHPQIPPTSNGVPQYPLYKRLASALERWIVSGTFFSTRDNVATLCEDDSLNEKKEYWNELVSKKGSELVEMLKSIKFELHVQEPYFSQLKDGKKTVEGRCAVGNYNRIQSGDMIFFNKCLMLEVQDVRHYSSFLEMLGTENLEDVLPGVLTIEEANVGFISVIHGENLFSINCEEDYLAFNTEKGENLILHNIQGEKIYRNFYTQEKEQFNGVVAIHVGSPASQPYIVLSDIISGLGYRGIQSLLGLKQTVGTIPEALPPPRSTLFSSFVSPHNFNIKGCTLAEGARALTKHVNRCSSNFWGKVEGNDSAKNQLAMEVITHIIDYCQWLNVHIVQPHSAVFEIRLPEGYGARWSVDGTKFIGFLEPYMEDGHSRKWRH